MYALRSSPPYHSALRRCSVIRSAFQVGPSLTPTMRAFVVTAPGVAGVHAVDPPIAGPGDVVVDVQRVGGVRHRRRVLHRRDAVLARRPRPLPAAPRPRVDGAGRVGGRRRGRDLDRPTRSRATRCSDAASAIAAAPAGNTCASGDSRWASAATSTARSPSNWPCRRGSLFAVPDSVDDVQGGARGAGRQRAACPCRPPRWDRAIVCSCSGRACIGVLAAMFCRAAGAEVHGGSLPDRSLEFAVDAGLRRHVDRGHAPPSRFSMRSSTHRTWHRYRRVRSNVLEPGQARGVYIGLAGGPSLIDSRFLALKDVTAVGILSASPGLAGAIEHHAGGSVDPRPLVAATIGLGDVAAVLAIARPAPVPARRSTSIPAADTVSRSSGARHPAGRRASRTGDWRRAGRCCPRRRTAGPPPRGRRPPGRGHGSRGRSPHPAGR